MDTIYLPYLFAFASVAISTVVLWSAYLADEL